MTGGIWHSNAGAPLVIRTDFTHQQEWLQILSMIAEPQTEAGFTVYVEIVEDPAYEGITAPRLLETVPADASHTFAFLVDTFALTCPDRPLLVVNLCDYAEIMADQGNWPQYGATFRVVPAAVWSVTSNLSIWNLDWNDFAERVGDDGIFRGFG